MHTYTALTNENVPVPLTNEKEREKSTTPPAWNQSSAWNVFWNSKWGCAAIEKRDMLGERGSGSKWDMRGPRQRGSDTRQTSVICIPIISALFSSSSSSVIRFLVTINMRGRFQKSLPLLYYLVLRFMECFYIGSAMLSELWCKVHGKFKDHHNAHERRSRSAPLI